MKTIFRSAMVIAAAAALCAGCNKENIEEIIPSADEFVTLDGTASFGGTRVELVGEKSMHWSAGDELAVIEFADGHSEYYGTSSSKTPKAPKATIEEGGAKAEFTAQLTKNDTAEEFNYYAVYPYSAFYSVAVTGDSSYKDLSITFPATQTPTNDFVDPAAAILVGRSDIYNAQGGEVGFTFEHLAAYVKLTVKGIPAESTPETITIASADTDKKIAGAFYWYYDEESKNAAGTASATQNAVTVNAENLTAGSDGEYTVWFTVHPTADLTNFTVTVDCEDEAYVATYEGDVTIEAGHIFNAEISVTEDESDYSGTYVIVAKDNDGKYHALSNDSSLANGGLVAKDFTYLESVKTDDATIVWTIAKDGLTYSLYNEAKGKYLARKSATQSGGSDWYDDTTDTETNLTIISLDAKSYQISSSVGILQLRSNGPDRFGFYNSANNINKLELIPAEIVALPTIDLNDNTKITLESESTSNSFDVTFYDVETTEAKAYKTEDGTEESDWLTVTHTSGNATIEYSATENDTESTRIAYIIIKAINSNGEKSAIVTVSQKAKQTAALQSLKLTNEQIVKTSGNSTTSQTNGYKDYTFQDELGYNWNANCICTYHSNATNSQFYIQIKNDASTYVKIPDVGQEIKKIVMTVSSSSGTMTAANNTATFYFRETSGSGSSNAIGSGTGAGEVTIDIPSNTLTTGYINAGAACRIWDIEVFY